MATTVYNPQKGRLETIDVEFTADNTTWFTPSNKAGDITMITDFAGDMLISEDRYSYPFRIYDISRADIDYDQKRAKLLKSLHE
jgi:hypothetical protein